MVALLGIEQVTGAVTASASVVSSQFSGGSEERGKKDAADTGDGGKDELGDDGKDGVEDGGKDGAGARRLSR